MWATTLSRKESEKRKGKQKRDDERGKGVEEEREPWRRQRRQSSVMGNVKERDGDARQSCYPTKPAMQCCQPRS